MATGLKVEIFSPGLLTPIVVATSSGTLNLNIQAGSGAPKSVLTMAGRYWVFYTEAFGSSTHGRICSTPTSGGAFTSPADLFSVTLGGQVFAVYYDSAHNLFYYVRSPGFDAVYYRYGTPNPDGTITWAISEATYNLGETFAAGAIALWADDPTNIWVGCEWVNGSTLNVLIISNMGGSWSPRYGPITNEAIIFLGKGTSGWVFASNYSTTVTVARSVDGSSWSTSAQSFSTLTAPISAAQFGDVTGFVSQQSSDPSLNYFTYNFGGAFSARTTFDFDIGYADIIFNQSGNPYFVVGSFADNSIVPWNGTSTQLSTVFASVVNNYVSGGPIAGGAFPIAFSSASGGTIYFVLVNV